MDEEDQWNPECWTWPVPDLGHLRDAHPLDVEEEALDALSHWQSSRCAMCGKVEPLKMDHDHRTGLVRGLLCHNCNTLEGVQHGDDTPLGRYRRKSPAIILGITVRYFDSFLGRYAEPEEERDEAEFLRRATEVVNAIQLGEPTNVQKPDCGTQCGEPSDQDHAD